MDEGGLRWWVPWETCGTPRVRFSAVEVRRVTRHEQPRAQRNNNIQPSQQAPTDMSKGTRFVTLAVPALIAYILLLLNVLPTPFLAEETAAQILPVVSS